MEKTAAIFRNNISDKSSDYIYNTEYFDEIYTNLLLEEKNAKLKIDKNYMNKQIYINERMRAVLVDWLADVQTEFNFEEKTLFQAIFIIDLFLSKKIIRKEKLQLLGTASLFIACKKNEKFFPKGMDFVGLTDNAFSIKELFDMEYYILKTINFEFFTATSVEFYNILSKAFNFDKKQSCLGQYFLTTSLLWYKILQYKKSVIAAASAYIVMKFFGIDRYKDLYSTSIIFDDLPKKTIKDCAKDLCFLVKNVTNSNFNAIKKKFSSERYFNVATLTEV